MILIAVFIHGFLAFLLLDSVQIARYVAMEHADDVIVVPVEFESSLYKLIEAEQFKKERY